MRTIIIGADGIIGSALCRGLSQRGHNVVGTTRRRTSIDPRRSIFLDLSQPQMDVDRLPDAEVAIICAAMARFADCRAQPDLARRVNVTAPEEIAFGLVKRGTRVVRLSSSAVFDCFSPNVRADWPTSSRSAYGQFQAEAEKSILALGPLTSVLRLTKIITPQFELFRNWMAALVRGETLEAFSDHRICPMLLECGVKAVAAVMEQSEGGIFQVSGDGDISYYDLALWLAGRLGLPRNRVVAVSAIDRGLLEGEVTPYTSMDTSRLTALTGFIPMEPFAVFDAVFGPTLGTPR